MIIFRYLTKEILSVILALVLILLFIFLSNQMVRYLDYIASGKYAASILFQLLALEVPYLLALLLPLSLYIGILIGFGRLYVDNEMTVMQACGMSSRTIYAAALSLSLIVMLVVGGLTLWINPKLAADKSGIMMRSMGQENLFETLVPGRFQEVPSGHVVYAERIDRDDKIAKNIFIAETPRVNTAATRPWTLIAADQAYQTRDPQTQDHFIVAANGYRYEGMPGQNTFTQVQFKKYGVRVKEITGKIGETLMLHHVPLISAERVLLVGCGKSSHLSDREFRKIADATTKALNKSGAQHAISFLTELEVKERDLPWKIRQIIEVSKAAVYCFDEFKSEKNNSATLKEITLHIPEKKISDTNKKAQRQGEALSDAVSFTKNLANLPSNICTPTYLAKEAIKLGKKYKLKTKVLDEAAMKKLGMNTILSVSQGSDEPAKLICLEYRGAKNKKPVALVGKGITFDTGGNSLKPADGMVGMKYDMCGAATVLGTMQAAAELKLPVNLVGIIAAAENMPGGSANKPEDIVKTLSGKTVEIMNTDAEGRLVLCDALTYCERYSPEIVIDIATLTGAVVIALGTVASGLLSSDDKLANDLLAASEQSADRAWRMPLWEDYQELLKSPFADMSNVGGRAAGVITAACFLSRFTKKFRWAHLDVAGTAAFMGVGPDRAATGRPVPMLVQFLLNHCKQ